MSTEHDDTASIFRYLRPEDADALERVCAFLNYAADNLGGLTGRVDGCSSPVMAAAMFGITAGALKDLVLPHLRAAAATED